VANISKDLLACFVSEKPLPSRIRHGEDTVEKIRANTMLWYPKREPVTNINATLPSRIRSMSAEEEIQNITKIEQTDKKLDEFLENNRKNLEQSVTEKASDKSKENGTTEESTVSNSSKARRLSRGLTNLTLGLFGKKKSS